MNADYVWKLSKFGRLTSTRLRFDDDFSDRLNYQFTGLLLFVFVGIIGIRQYVGKPIHCWTPQEFTRSWEEYAENYCWVASTYFVHYNSYHGPPPPQMVYHRESVASEGYLVPLGYRFSAQHQPMLNAPGEKPPPGRYISYYQWAPILLAIQSLFFYLPCLIWRLFYSQSGFHLRRIMQLASEAALTAPTEADTTTQGTPDPQRLSVQNLINLMQSNSNIPVASFAPTKSVRTLARYLDMCLMRQREMRLADFLSTIHSKHFSDKKGMKARDLEQSIPAGQINIDPSARVLSSSAPPIPTRPNHSSVSVDSESMMKPQGTNCLDAICCCGLVSWCFRRMCCLCYQCQRKETYKHYVGSSEKHRTLSLDHQLRDYFKRTGNSKKDSIHTLGDMSLPFSQLGTNNSLCCSCCEGEPNRRIQSPTITQRLCGKHQGNFLVRLHMFVKLLYLGNIVGQIYLLEYYTGVHYNFYGVRVLYDLVRGRQWEESGHFPRVTFCDFEARKLAQSHYYTLQCVLPINMFLEKIYIFLWLWLFMVGIVTLCSIFVWLSRISTKSCRYSWIRYQLIALRLFHRPSPLYMHFVDNHLGPDGVFVLRLIAQNYGDLVAGDTVGELWTAYWQRHQSGQTTTKQVQDKPTDRISNDPSRHSPAPSDSRHSHAHIPRPNAKPLHLPVRKRLEASTSPPKQKYPKKKHLTNTGYSATMLATEMIHPSDRFAVPLLTCTRVPPSLHSHGSSRYSQDSRNHDRSDSPPPIPQRSSDGGDYSLSDHHSAPDFALSSSSQSTQSRHRQLSLMQTVEVEFPQIDTSVDEDDVNRDLADVYPEDRADLEVGADLMDQKDDIHFRESYHHDDNIV